MACPSCGSAAPEGAHFCPRCGADLEGRHDERRVVTVLFADIVGFTTLSEARDPEQVKNLVDRCFERMVAEINAYGGVVDKIIGDAIVALFGAPLAHEDDAERAVRAALQMQQSLREREADLGVDLQMRIGVNTGEVLVGALRAGGDYTAMGDVVNSAQRLETAARPGSVLVGRATYVATNDVIDYEPVGQLDAKGREEPIEAWEARAEVQPPGYRVRRHTPLMGRDAELGMLRHALDTAVERRRAHLVLLLGEAGVGKTRLAEEVAEAAACHHEALVLEGRCVPYGEANVWWPIAEALRQVLGVGSDDDVERATARARAAIAEIEPAGAAIEGEGAVEQHRLVDGALHLLGYEASRRSIDPARARDEAAQAVLALLEAAARRRPFVLVLSDLHWADDVVLELVDDVVEHLARHPVLVVATARHELPDRWSARQGRHNTLVVNLDPLDRDAADALLGHLVDDDVPSEVRDLLLDRSGGNPFFLEELVALVGDTQVAAAASRLGGWQTSLGELPDTLRGLVAARLDALSPIEKHTLEDAAVWGRSGPLVALETMAQTMRGTTDLTAVVGGLVDKDILVVDGSEWSFRSDLVRDVAYSTLTKADRARRHYGIAHYFESAKPQPPDPAAADDRFVDMVAHHFAAAADLVAELGPLSGVGRDVTECALRWVGEAARRAEEGQVLPVAVRLFGQALRLTGADRPDLRVRFLLGRAGAASELRDLDQAERDIAEASDLAAAHGDEAGLARADLVLGELVQRRGDGQLALEILQRANDRFEALGDADGRSEVLRCIGMTRLFRGEHDLAEVVISEALEISRQVGDRRGEAWAVQQLAWISFVTGRAIEAERRLLTAIDIFRTIGDRSGLGWARGMLAYAMYQQGRLDEAADVADEVLEEAQRRGDLWGEGMMSVLAASVRLWSGRAAEAIGRAEAASAIFERIDDRFGEVNAAAVHGRSLVAVGRLTEGFAALAAGAGMPRDEPDEGLIFLGLTALAGAAVQVGEPERAARALGNLDDAWVASVDSTASERLVALGVARLQRGDVAGSARPLERAASFSVGDEASSYALANLALVRAAQGDVDAVLALDKRVNDSPRATYLDKGTAKLAAILVRARRGDADAASRFEAVVHAADRTDDRVAQAMARLTRAYGLEALRAPAAGEARREAEQALGDLGLGAHGWRRAIELILSASPDAGAPAGSAPSTA